MNDPSIGFFCINLPARTDRRRHIEELADALGIEIEFVDGVVGKDLDLGAVPEYDRERRLHYHVGDLSGGQVGCALAQRRALLALSKSEYDFGVVFEDDCTVEDGFLDFVREACRRTTGWDGIQLRNHYQENGDRRIERVALDLGRWKILMPQPMSLNANCYLYTRAGAAKLARWLDRFDRPADYHIRESHLAGIVLAEVSPSLSGQSASASDNPYLAENEKLKPRLLPFLAYALRRIWIKARRIALVLRTGSLIRTIDPA